MKKFQITAAIVSLLCAAALTACGSDPIPDSTAAETTTAAAETTETTTGSGAETTTTTEKTTADQEKETETSKEETTAEAEDTTTTQATTTTTQTEAPATTTTTQAANTLHLFDELKIGGSAANYRAAHTNFTEITSDACLSGVNHQYTYPDFVLTVNVDNGVEKIESIKITGAGVATREGIRIGSTKEEVQNAYGAESSADFFTKTTADGNLEVVVQNGLVTEIFLYAL